MACEKKCGHDASPVVCTVPQFEKEEQSRNSHMRLRVFGFITVVTTVAILVAGAVSIVYLVSSKHIGGSTEEHTSDVNSKEVLVEFNFHGKSHTELVNIDEDRGAVIITDTNDGFSVTLDKDRGIAMIKNETSTDCFFTRLEYIPEYDANNIFHLRPIVVEEVSNAQFLQRSANEKVITLYRSDVIPREYMQVSNRPVISKRCIDSTSYWLEGNRPITRARRLPQQETQQIIEEITINVNINSDD